MPRFRESVALVCAMLFWMLAGAGQGFAQSETPTPYIYDYSFLQLSQPNRATGLNANPKTAVVAGVDFSTSPTTEIRFTFSDGSVVQATTSYVNLDGETQYLVASVPTPPAGATGVNITACNFDGNGTAYCSDPYQYNINALPPSGCR